MLQHQFATAPETVYGTPVTPNRFHEFLAGESLGRANTILNSSGLRPGLNARLGSRRVLTARAGGGGVSFEVAATTFGRFFEHMLGGTGSVFQQESTAAYLHTYTPGDLVGKSLTVQKGVEKIDGTVQPFTGHGGKVTRWGFSISKNGLCILALEFDFEDIDDSTALAEASYPTLSLFHFAQATLSKGGVAVANVTDFSIEGTNPCDTERYFLGSSGLKAEPLPNDYRTLGGQITADFADITTFHDAFEADTSLDLELQFQGALIESGASADYYRQLTITGHDIRLVGETPKVSGPAPAVQNIPFEGYEQDDGVFVTVEYQTTDTAV